MSGEPGPSAGTYLWHREIVCKHSTCKRKATLWVTNKGQWWCIECINGQCGHEEEK